LALTITNTSFCLKNYLKFEEAGILINKGILILEFLEKITHCENK